MVLVIRLCNPLGIFSDNVILSRIRAAILRDVYLDCCINKAYGLPITVDETGIFCCTGDLMSSVRSTFRLYL